VFSIHLYFRREPIEQQQHRNNEKSKKQKQKIKALLTSNADIQNVVQCHCHMHGSDVENHFYETVKFMQIELS